MSKRNILFALVCGAASTVPAMLWELIASMWEVVALQARDLSPFMVGFIEEWCKVACLYSFLRRNEFNWRTATLLGLYAGLGFATIENLVYSTRIIRDGSHALPSLGIFLLSRSITAVMHALWSMLTCRILLFYKKDTLQIHFASINGFLLVAALHGIWDLPILITFDRRPTLQMILHDPRLSCLPISLLGTILMVCFMYVRRQEVSNES